MATVRKKSLFWVIASVALFCAVLGVLTYAWLNPPAVVVVAVHKGDAIEATYGTGTVEALDRADLKPRVSGSVIESLVREGEHVKMDQVLARLNAPAAESEFTRARGELASVEARAAALGAELLSAKTELERTKQLVKSATVSSADAERASSRVSVLQAELSGLDAQRRALRSDVVSRTSNSSAEGARSRDLEIRSPIDGIVLRRAVAIGDFVTPLRTAFVVGKLDALVVDALVDESDISKVTRETPVSLGFRLAPGKTFSGKVLEIPLDADREKQAYVVKVAISNPPTGLRTGMAAELNFVLAKHPSALLVAAAAVGPESTVLLVRKGRLVRQKVRIGLQGRREVEVLEGLAEGDTVVGRFDDKLVPGTRVRSITEPGPSAP
ncbi:MAG: efflux RND transporter periplasmic adaptor subunit [Polyangiaceae bacterium]